MPLKLTYNVWHEDYDEPVHTCGRKDEAIAWCRKTYHESERRVLVVTYHNPHAKSPLRDHAGCLKLPDDFL
jgi:hypothetical protein